MKELKDYVVSPALAKRMGALGWEKKTIFCWVKLKSQKKSRLCFYSLRGIGFDEQFYTVGDCELLSFWDIEKFCYAPLFAEIVGELPNEIQYDLDIPNKARLTMGMGTHSCAKETDFCIYYEKDTGKELWESFFNDPNPAESAGELWCWDVEWTILQGVVKDKKEK